MAKPRSEDLIAAVRCAGDFLTKSREWPWRTGAPPSAHRHEGARTAACVRFNPITALAGKQFSPHTADMSMRVLAVALGTVCVLAGCGGGQGDVLRSEDSTVLVGAKVDGDSLAGIGYSGTVAMVGQCLGLNEATVIWPHGTQIASDDPLTIDVPGLG